MRIRIRKHYRKFFLRSYGKLCDEKIDASMLALVWPFEIVSANDKKAVNTVKEIEKKLLHKGGIYRYEHDIYDGWLYKNLLRRKGAGTWPLLTFWLSIYYSKRGDRKKAEYYFNSVIKGIKSNLIPEQLFDNKIQKSVTPLGWSHAMFVFAAKESGYL